MEDENLTSDVLFLYSVQPEGARGRSPPAPKAPAATASLWQGPRACARSGFAHTFCSYQGSVGCASSVAGSGASYGVKAGAGRRGRGWAPLPDFGRSRGLGAKPRCRRQRADAPRRRCDFVARASPCTPPSSRTHPQKEPPHPVGAFRSRVCFIHSLL